MEYLVIHEAAGTPVYDRVDDLDAAIEQVERLRNEEAVEAAAIYELRAVSFEFEPYFRVALSQEAGDHEIDPAADDDEFDDDDQYSEVGDSETGATPIRRIDLRDPDRDRDVVVGFADFPNRRGLFGR